MNLQQTVSEILKRDVSIEEAKDFANDQFGVLSTYLKQGTKDFPNGFTSWIETYFEFVNLINLNSESKFVNSRRQTQGIGGIYELAEELTDEYEKFFEDEDYAEIDFFDTITKYFETKMQIYS